jgi:small subunit ribosomal protein S6
MLLLRPDLEEDKLQSAVEKVTRAVVNGGGALTKVSPWGKRRLAYEINHHREASYFLLNFDIDPSKVREIERGMLISEEILRHLVTVIEDRPGQSEEDLPDAVEPASSEERFETDEQPAVEERADESREMAAEEQNESESAAAEDDREPATSPAS